MKKLITSAKTPKGMVIGATVLLTVVIGAYAISTFAWSGTCTEISKTSSSGSYKCNKGQYYKANYSKRYCVKGSSSSNPVGYALTTNGTTITVNAGSFNICTKEKGSAKFVASKGNWKFSWKYY